jgi:Na+-transporting NADH:ubiquinone oxidoreductase subunit B
MKIIFIKQKIMNRVLYALIPILLYAIYLFGWRVLFIILITNLFAFLTEYIFIKNKPKGKVSTAVFVTGSLLALTLPPTIPLWMAAVGAVVAVSFGKMVFGGFGMNMFNPAIVGRTFLYVAFPNAMTVQWMKPFTSIPGGFAHFSHTQYVTSATPMIQFKQAGVLAEIPRLFFGMIPGSIGETSALLIIIAALYLIFTKTAKWQPIVATLLSFIIFTLIFYGKNPLFFLLSGGIMFGSVFMVTDPVSMPKEKYSIWIYGILVGFLTVFIRRFSLFAEGFMFALLIANTFMPIIEYAMKKLIQKNVKPAV